MISTVPRLMIAATGSHSGKTVVTLALTSALKRMHTDVATFKAGPDYVDPMFHAEVFGRRGQNLDLYLAGAQIMTAIYGQAAQGHDIAITEGVMGFYDGLGGVSAKCSTWDIARKLQMPVLLVLDCRRKSVSAAAAALGFATYKENAVAGFILDGAAAEVYPRLKKKIEKATGLPVVGHLPRMDDASFESRHLGLMAPTEIESIQRSIASMGQAFFLCSDMSKIIEIASQAPPLSYTVPQVSRLPRPVRIAFAQDAAFSYFYPATLEILDEMNCEIVPFSPLKDKGLPSGADGLLLGGGPVEMYARRLSANETMLESVRNAIRGGMPTIAEGGGFLYLHEMLADPEDNAYPMAGLFPGTAERGPTLSRFGYVKMTATTEGMLHPTGTEVHAHSSHYWLSPHPGQDYIAQKPKRPERFRTGYVSPTMYAAFPHLYLAGEPDAAWRFAQACLAYKERETVKK
ncbi:MAG: cobyrinate a,c-diamide synthase [Clostridia bacterium]|nr:cobyrinate a,c-diamide synthase [Clostridia bacterium]